MPTWPARKPKERTTGCMYARSPDHPSPSSHRMAEVLSSSRRTSRELSLARTSISICSKGIRQAGNYAALHLTSHKFDEPRCLALLSACDHVVAIHGCGGKAQRVLMGGLDDPLKISIGQAIARLGVEVDLKGHSFPATDPNNICNRGRRGVGVQVELTLGLRLDGPRDAVSAAIRSVLLNLPNELPGGDQRR